MMMPRLVGAWKLPASVMIAIMMMMVIVGADADADSESSTSEPTPWDGTAKVFWYVGDTLDVFDVDVHQGALEKANDLCTESMGGRLCYHEEICPFGELGEVEIGASVFDDSALSPIQPNLKALVPHKSCSNEGKDEWMMIVQQLCGGTVEYAADADAAGELLLAIPCCVDLGDSQDICPPKDFYNDDAFESSFNATDFFLHTQNMLGQLPDIQHIHHVPNEVQGAWLKPLMKALKVPETHRPKLLNQLNQASKSQGPLYDMLRTNSLYEDYALTTRRRLNADCSPILQTVAVVVDAVGLIWTMISSGMKLFSPEKLKKLGNTRVLTSTEGRRIIKRIKELWHNAPITNVVPVAANVPAVQIGWGERTAAQIGAMFGRNSRLLYNIVDLFTMIWNAGFVPRILKAMIRDWNWWDTISAVGFGLAQMFILFLGGPFEIVGRLAKIGLYTGDLMRDIELLLECESDEQGETSRTQTGDRRGLLSLSTRDVKSLQPEDPSACASPDSKHYVVIMGSVVKGLYEDFQDAFQVLLVGDVRNDLSGTQVRHGIIEVTSGYDVHDPRYLQVNGRRQELGHTAGFQRYWKDEAEVAMMMEAAKNFLSYYVGCFRDYISGAHWHPHQICGNDEFITVRSPEECANHCKTTYYALECPKDGVGIECRCCVNLPDSLHPLNEKICSNEEKYQWNDGLKDNQGICNGYPAGTYKDEGGKAFGGRSLVAVYKKPFAIYENQVKDFCGITANQPKCYNAATNTTFHDRGYWDQYQGWYDIEGCGECRAYCRWVGYSGSGGDPKVKTVHGKSKWLCNVGKERETTNYHKPFNFKRCPAQDTPPCLSAATPNSIGDKGFEDAYRGWYDISGCGYANYYCRWVGNSGSGGDPTKRRHYKPATRFQDSYWACTNGEQEYDTSSFFYFSYYSPQNHLNCDQVKEVLGSP